MGTAYAKLERMKDIPAPAGTSTYRVQHATEDGYTLAYGTTVPTDATTGFAPGCIFFHVDGSAGATLYVNNGTKASCEFDAVVSEDSIVATLVAANLTSLKIGGVTYTLPAADGAAGQQLQTDGSAVLTWENAGGTFAGGDITGDVHMANGIYIMSETGAGNASAIQVRDDDAAAFRNALSWTNGNTPAVVLGAAQDSLAITSTGLNVTTAGAVTGVTMLNASGLVTASSADLTGAAGLTLENDATITNSTDSEIKFTDGGEDLILDMDSTANTIGLKSSTGVTGIAFGDVDDLSGIGSIAFDSAASTITLAATGAAQDLTIQVTGAQNSSLVLSSAGTEADALQVLATAGGIDITASSSEDIDVSGTGGINIISSENAAGALTLNSSTGANSTTILSNTSGTGESAVTITGTAGGVDIDAAAAKDVDISGGQVLISNKTAGASAVAVTLNQGAADTLVLTNTQGTDTAAINIDATAGGIDIDAGGVIAIDSADDMTLTVTSGGDGEDLSLIQSGANNSSIIIQAAGTGADAISLAAAAGTVKIAGDLIDMDSTGDFNLTVTSSGAGEDLLLNQVGAQDASITLTAAGTGADAIGLQATAGGIDVDGGAGGDIVITSTGKSVVITATEEATDAVKLDASTGAGGITLTAGTGGVNITGNVNRTAQQYVQTISYCKVGTTAGWVVPAAADAAHLATLPAGQTASTLVIPIMVPLKVGWTITAWTLNGQIDSGGNAATLDAAMFKHTEAEAGYTNAAVGAAMTQLSKTADYKVVDGKSGLSEVVAADESYYLLLTGTTAAATDIEIAGITVTVTET